MTKVNATDRARSTHYETPTFDPRSAFSWSLRAGEIARLEIQERRNGLPVSTRPGARADLSV